MDRKQSANTGREVPEVEVRDGCCHCSSGAGFMEGGVGGLAYDGNGEHEKAKE